MARLHEKEIEDELRALAKQEASDAEETGKQREVEKALITIDKISCFFFYTSF